MNTQIHRKQIIILMLAMALAAASYWIPLPQQSLSSQPYPSSSILRESTNLSTPTETVSYVREPATIWRFPVTIQIPQTPVQVAPTPRTEDTQSVQILSPARLMNQRDFANGSGIPTINPPLMPVKELNYDLKR